MQWWCGEQTVGARACHSHAGSQHRLHIGTIEIVVADCHVAEHLQLCHLCGDGCQVVVVNILVMYYVNVLFDFCLHLYFLECGYYSYFSW